MVEKGWEHQVIDALENVPVGVIDLFLVSFITCRAHIGRVNGWVHRCWSTAKGTYILLPNGCIAQHLLLIGQDGKLMPY
jgi:hypothetical protein